VNLQSASHNSGAWSNDETIDFTWIAPSSAAPITGYRYVVDTNPGTVIATGVGTLLPGATTSTTITVVNPINFFHIIAVDEAGNYGATDHFEIRFDNISPKGATVSINNGSAYSATREALVTLAISAEDDESGMLGGRMQFSNDGAIWCDAVAEIFATTKTWDITNVSCGGDATEGEKKVYLRVSDGAGNWTTTEVSDTINYDLSAPITGSVQVNGTDEATATNNVVLTLQASDGGSGLRKVRVSNDGLDWFEADYVTTLNWDLTTGYGGTATEQEKTIYVQFEDNASNTLDVTDTIIYDLSAPNTGSFQIGNGAGTKTLENNLVTIQVTQDAANEASIVSMYISNDNTTFTTAIPFAATYNNWNIVDPNYGGGDDIDGVKTVYVQFEDSVGHRSTTSISANITLDRVGPTGGDFTINGGGSATSSLVVTLDNITATDNAGGAGVALGQMRFSNDASTWSGWEVIGATKSGWDLSSFGGNSNPETKRVYVQFMDSAGNESSVEIYKEITYFTSNPVDHFTLTPANPGQIAGMQAQMFTLEMQDNLNNPATEAADRTVYLYIDSLTGAFDTSGTGAFDGTVVSVIVPAHQPSVQFYYRDNAVLADLPHQVSLVVSDHSPVDSPDTDITNASVTFNITDLTSPTFIGLTSGAATSETGATLVWQVATDDYTVDAANITYNIYRAEGATSTGTQDFNTPVASITTVSPGVVYDDIAGTITYSISGLTPATFYYYVVRARDTLNNEDTNTTEVMIQTPIAGGDVIPPTFAGLASGGAIANSNSRIDLSWPVATDNVTNSGDIVYNIYRSETSGAQVFTTPTYQVIGDTTFSDTGLSSNTEYFYVIRARDESLNEELNTAEQSATTYATPDTGAPTFAGLEAATALDQGTIRLTWQAATDDQTNPAFIQYRIYRSTATMVGNTLPSALTTVMGDVSFNDTGLAQNTTYYYIVRAYDAATPQHGEVNEEERSATTPQTQTPQQPSTGGGGGGGGGGYAVGASPYKARTIYASMKDSDVLLKSEGAISFAKTQGYVARPMQIVDKFNNIVATLQKGTQINNLNGSPFVGALKPPFKLQSDEITIPVPENIQPLGKYVYKFGTLGEVFDKTYNVEAPSSLVIRKMLEKGYEVKPFAWSHRDQKWLPIETENILTEDGKYFSLDIDRSTIILFAVDSGVEIKEEVETEDLQPEVKEVPTDIPSEAVFKDIDQDSKYFYAVQKLLEIGVIDSDNSKFKPNKSANRAEAVKMTLKAFGLKPHPVKSTTFSDMNPDEWFAPFAERARFLSIVPTQSLFRPADKITRAEAVIMTIKASLLSVPENIQVATADIANKEVGRYVAFAEQKGVIELDDEGNFYPNDKITRGDFALLTQKVLQITERASEDEFLAFYPKSEPILVVTPDDTKPFERNFKKGDMDADISRAKKVMYLLGFYKGDFDQEFDDDLAESIYQFQSSLGVVPSREFYGAGMIGRGTRREINDQLKDINEGSYTL